jgi:hypothetical protein
MVKVVSNIYFDMLANVMDIRQVNKKSDLERPRDIISSNPGATLPLMLVICSMGVERVTDLLYSKVLMLMLLIYNLIEIFWMF